MKLDRDNRFFLSQAILLCASAWQIGFITAYMGAAFIVCPLVSLGLYGVGKWLRRGGK